MIAQSHRIGLRRIQISIIMYLKDLANFARSAGLPYVENVLLIDDSPSKNLLNDTHNTVHPESWSGDDNDNF